jgi:hypothetical protein
MADPSLTPKPLTNIADLPASDLTPLFANKVTVTMNPQLTRIAFGYFVVGDQTKDVLYHSVMVMPTAEAEALGRTLVAIAEDTKKKVRRSFDHASERGFQRCRKIIFQLPWGLVQRAQLSAQGVVRVVQHGVAGKEIERRPRAAIWIGFQGGVL